VAAASSPSGAAAVLPPAPPVRTGVSRSIAQP